MGKYYLLYDDFGNLVFGVNTYQVTNLGLSVSHGIVVYILSSTHIPYSTRTYQEKASMHTKPMFVDSISLTFDE
jgi:hypothetical protein